MNVTPLMGLPYPGPGDAPCDFDEQWCQFTSAVDAVFDDFEAVLARTMPSVPAAIIQLTQQAVLDAFTQVPYDTVLFDNASMTNLEVDPFSISIPKTGRYTVGAYVLSNPAGVNSSFLLTVQVISPTGGSGSVPIETYILDRGGALGYGNNAHWEAFDMLEGSRVIVEYGWSALVDVAITEAWLAVYWHADEEVAT